MEQDPGLAAVAYPSESVSPTAPRQIRDLVDRLATGASRHQDAVLARVVAFSRTGREAPDLDELARAVGEGLGARWCRLSVSRTGVGERSYRWPAGADQPEAAAESVVAVRFRDEQVGAIGLDTATVTRLRRPGRRLFEDIVAVLGPILHSARLSLELHEQLHTAVGRAQDIAASRRRAVAQMEAERRALERDLHDGAQHHLVAMRMTVGLLEHELSTGATASALARLEQLTTQLDLTEGLLVSIAGGILPVALVTAGLVPALESELRAVPGLRLDIEPAVAGRRYPAPVETAVYFTCLEAVSNARKHAAGASVVVALRDTYRGLSFEVSDDGPGFVPTKARPDSGLVHLAERIAAVRGTLTIRSAPGRGTIIAGLIPL